MEGRPKGEARATRGAGRGDARERGRREGRGDARGRQAHLGSTVGTPQHAESDEDRVGQSHQDVVHTVHVHKLYSAPLHVL